MRVPAIASLGLLAFLAGGSALWAQPNRLAQPPQEQPPQEQPARTREGPPLYVAAGPAALLEAARPLLEHRAREGMQVALVTTEGPESLARIRRQLAAKPADYLLLLGDVATIPHQVVRKCATDRPYGDLDDDGYPDLAIGRIPSDDPRVIRGVAERTIRYEREREAGLWQKQCALLANEGRFSPEIDAVIERVFARVVKQVLPTGYDVDLTYANPRSTYCYPPRRFGARVIERLNEGALVFAYIGHGSKRSLDSLVVGSESYSVLSTEDAARLDLSRRSPIMVAIACWTGNYDGRRQSLGEELIASPRGPVAFFGASRISHPVHNALLAKELVCEFFAGDEVPRLGPALDRARRALAEGRPDDRIRAQIITMANLFVGAKVVEEEMPRHVDMYNLFGDPALKLARPAGRITLETSPLRRGRALVVEGRVEPGAAMSLRVTLETDREAMAVPRGREGESRLERYARANDKVLRAALAATRPDGTFRVELSVPAELPAGRYMVKAFASRGATSAVGGLVRELD